MISLIREAASTWQGNLCLHLQPHPIPWIFVVPPPTAAIEVGQEGEEADEDEAQLTSSMTIVSQDVLEELLDLFKKLKQQGRKVHLILQQNFLPHDTLAVLVQAMAPILIRVETNHPEILNWLCSCPALQTLVMELTHPQESRQRLEEQLDLLSLLLNDPACQLRGLHLHMGYAMTKNNRTTCTDAVIMEHLFSNLATILYHKSQQSLESIKLSGQLNYGALNLLSCAADRDDGGGGSSPATRLRKLEVESNHARLIVTDGDDPNSCIVDCSSETEDIILSSRTLLSGILFAAEGPHDSRCGGLYSQITHFTLRVRQLLLLVDQSPPNHTFTTVPSLTHLTLQAGLTTPMVDRLLLELPRIAPNLQELDLEGNDMESLDLPQFLTMNSASYSLSERSWERLYLGSNLFSYSSQMKAIERLLQACPRLDVGHRGMPSCGIFMDDDDGVDNDFWMTTTEGGSGQRCRRPPSLFTSWAHGTPVALAWKDWNQHGRYMILMDQHHQRDNVGGGGIAEGLWPLALEQITIRFEQRPERQATLFYQFLRSGVIPLREGGRH